MAGTWLGTVLISAVGFVLQDTIDRVTWDKIGFCLFMGMIFGTIWFVLSGALQAGVLLMIRITKPRRIIRYGMLLLPLLAIALLMVGNLIPRYSRSHQPVFFTNILHKPYPKELNLITWGHGFGLQDRRHFWMFEGTTEQFNAFKSTMGLKDAKDIEDSLPGGAMEQVIAACPPGNPWTPGDAYYWDEETKDPADANRGMVYVDKNLHRWVVWWSAI